MAKQQVTLYIDDSSISMLVSKGREPLKWASVSLEADLVKEGVVVDQAAVAEKLKQVIRDSRVAKKRVTFAISGINCLYQLLLLPDLPENLRGEAINREASQSLGISLEGVYLAWQVLSVEHGQMKVFLAVMPRDKVDSCVATLRLAGLRPDAMDVKPLCLARASSEPKAILVDTRQEAFDIVVLGDGIPEVVRSLCLPSGTPAGEGAALVRSELERAISFYNAAHMDKPIDLTVPVLVSGDLAAQDSEKAALAGPRERPVRNLESPMVEEESFDHGRYMTCIGLALKEVLLTEPGAMANSNVNFNALPAIYQIHKRPLNEILWLPTVLVGVVLMGMGIWGYSYLKGQNDDLSARVADTNQRIVDQKVGDKDIATLRNQVTAAQTPGEAMGKMVDGMEEDRVVMATDLDVVEDMASSVGVYLGGVTVTKSEINITALAPNSSVALEYGWLLMNSGRFSSVMIPNITDSGTGAVNVSMQVYK
jgi:type IV pilus assembly protein PilM